MAKNKNPATVAAAGGAKVSTDLFDSDLTLAGEKRKVSLNSGQWSVGSTSRATATRKRGAERRCGHD
jgi:hypothetical protein